MAEGLLRSFAGARFEVLSAGTKPVGLNPLAVEAMSEIGIDISQHRSKNVSQYLGQAIQYVVTVCDTAKESCPIFPSSFKFLHWSLEDPAAVTGSHAEKLAAFRQIRDQIRAKIQTEFGEKDATGTV